MKPNALFAKKNSPQRHAARLWTSGVEAFGRANLNPQFPLRADAVVVASKLTFLNSRESAYNLAPLTRLLCASKLDWLVLVRALTTDDR